MSEKAEMLGLADALEVQLHSYSHLALTGKTVREIIRFLRAVGAEPVGYGYSAEIQSAHGMHLHVSREKAGVYDTPLFLAAIPAPAPASGREEIASVLAERLWCGATFEDALQHEKEAFLSAADAVIALLRKETRGHE